MNVQVTKQWTPLGGKFAAVLALFGTFECRTIGFGGVAGRRQCSDYQQ